jgi:hypothetical protein
MARVDRRDQRALARRQPGRRSHARQPYQLIEGAGSITVGDKLHSMMAPYRSSYGTTTTLHDRVFSEVQLVNQELWNERRQMAKPVRVELYDGFEQCRAAQQVSDGRV